MTRLSPSPVERHTMSLYTFVARFRSTPPAVVVAVAVIAAVIAGGLTGCSLPARPGLTLAYTASINEPAPSTGPITELITEHADSARYPEDGMVTIVAPGTRTTIDLTPMRGSEVEANPGVRRDAMIADKSAELADTVGDLAASMPGLDPVGVLDQALQSTDPGGTVVITTSGFATVAPLDLTSAGAWMSAPTALADAVGEGDLPDATDKNITFAGLGYPAVTSSQQAAGPATRDALTTLYTRLCERMNAASCTIVDGPVGTFEPTTTVASPTVTLDRIATHCVGQIDIDSKLAFSPDSADLLPAVGPQLNQVVDSLRACPATAVITAIGYSATVPGQDEPGTDLELARAAAVLTRLRDLGVPSHILGAATAGGQIVDNFPGGAYREDLASRNRVVTLTVIPGI